MIPDFENLLLSNEGRLRALEYFTGGNPRLSLMLYKIITQSDISEVKKALEKLLDEVTPYYKAKTESLPAQQRKILDHIAKISGQTGEGLTPGEIAVSIRLSPNLVSSQLKRLSEVGYVRCANLRGRRKFYALSEPLYSIWYQMRMGKNAKERLGWLINFLKLWYSPGEVIKEFERLFTIFHEHLNKESWIKARDVLEHGEYLVDAVKETPEYYKISDQIKIGKSETEEKATIEYDKGCKALEDDKFDEALTFFTDAIDIKPDFYMAWLKKGNAFLSLGKINDAIRSYDRAQGLFLNFEHAFENACSMLQINHEEGVKNIIKAFEVYPEELAKRYLDILDAFPKNKIPWKTRMQSYLLLYIFHIIQGDLNQAKKDIVEAQESKNYIDPSEYINNLIPSLIVSFILKNDMMNRLILSMELSGEGFPLFRAIDYFIKGDKALIEKLNPEIKKIVLEITEQLKETSGEKRKHEIKPQKRKPKYQLRHRTRKQL
ncbi:hypothetical protein JW926_16465 [Candidatus Sumerlaeota bacterium]|nr:hypothetical protein [Candidatus Sumerlaeota bacterium]